MLHPLLAVTLALLRTCVTSLDAGADDGTQRARVLLGLSTHDSAGGLADVGAVEIGADALVQGRDVLLAQACVRAGRARRRAVVTGLDATREEMLVHRELARMGVKHLAGVGHQFLRQVVGIIRSACTYPHTAKGTPAAHADTESPAFSDNQSEEGTLRMVYRRLLTLLAYGALVGTGCGSKEGEQPAGDGSVVGDSGPVHIHGLGINPKDGALFIATHTGLFRAAADERRSVRVADRFQDTMGFTIVGPDRFLGSGHPDLQEGLPPFLGLIESQDAGTTWRPVSLLGKRDFHVLEAQDQRIYGFGSDFDTREEALLVSDDSGRTWRQRRTPESLISLAIDPEDSDRIVASGSRRIYLSGDAGRRWRAISGPPSLVVWPATGRLVAAAPGGQVRRTDRPGAAWRDVGNIGGDVAAIEASGRDELYVALHDGTVKRSADGGVSWSVRSEP